MVTDDGGQAGQRKNEPASALRWQLVTMRQLGYALNLIFTLNVGTIGYWFFLLLDTRFCPPPAGRDFMWVALACLVFSALCGLVCMLNRLADFRGTARRARHDLGAPSKGALRLHGRWTWRPFLAQIVGFSLGITALGAALLITAGGKLA
jgi:hypothetical protein